MRNIKILTGLLIAGLLLAGCSGTRTAAADFEEAVGEMTQSFNDLAAELQGVTDASGAAKSLNKYAAIVPTILDKFQAIQDNYSEEELAALNEDEAFTESMTVAYEAYQEANLLLFQAIGGIIEEYGEDPEVEEALEGYFYSMTAAE